MSRHPYRRARHRRRSPLRELYASGALQRSLKGAGEALLIHAVVQAFDNVYGGDLSATHTYGKGSLLEGAFADMIRSEGGRTTIDWDNFNATRPLGFARTRRGPGAFSAATRPALHLVRQCPRLVRHGQRARRWRAALGPGAVLSLLDAPVSVIGRGRR